jgi:hypothetical protein
MRKEQMADVLLFRRSAAKTKATGIMATTPRTALSCRQSHSPRLTVQELGFDLPFSFHLDDTTALELETVLQTFVHAPRYLNFTWHPS